MSERFQISGHDDKLYDLKTEKHYYFEDLEDWYKLCGLLNELVDENNELKQRIKELEE